MKDLAAWRKTAFAVALVSVVLGCAPYIGTVLTDIAAGIGTEAAYHGAFREKMEDISKLPEEDQIRLRQVRIFTSAARLEGTPKGKVVGLACKVTTGVFAIKLTWKPELNEANGLTPDDVARNQLRLKAMRKGANAVVVWSCTHKENVDWGNDCFESWRCTGQALVIP